VTHREEGLSRDGALAPRRRRGLRRMGGGHGPEGADQAPYILACSTSAGGTGRRSP